MGVYYIQKWFFTNQLMVANNNIHLSKTQNKIFQITHLFHRYVLLYNILALELQPLTKRITQKNAK